MPGVSLRDVAALAGVSFQTASKVLNGKGTVSKQTEERILEAARELGYVPNALARNLVTQSTSTIGILASNLSDYVLAQFVVGAEREARKMGRGVLICSLDEEGSDAARCLRMLVEHRVGGILAAAPQLEEDEEVGRMLREWEIPAVSIHHVPGGGVSLVGSDHARTAYLATGHLIDHGHRRIATVAGSPGRRVTKARLKGYERALEEAVITPDPSLVEFGDWEPEGGYRAALRLLERAPDVTAIFVQSDLMAFGVLHALYDRGLSVPGDCALLGCDDIPMAAHALPPLTTVRVPFYETGGAAVRLLLEEAAERNGRREQRLLLPVELVRRRTCGCETVTD